MINQLSSLNSYSSSVVGSAKSSEAEKRFTALIDSMSIATDTKEKKAKNDISVSSKQLTDTRLPGDFISSFALLNPTDSDTHAVATGAAANSGMNGSINKASKLYEQSMELESFFVKMMLSSMRATVSKSELSGDSGFAGKMYEDMMYDELSRTVTKSAGFGLADQVYLQLSGQR